MRARRHSVVPCGTERYDSCGAVQCHGWCAGGGFLRILQQASLGYRGSWMV